MEQHNKIINAVAKQYLAPEGLFRVGLSRSWVEDNGYFLTLVEFQPSNCCRGTYLNVGIDFMWEHSKSLNEILSYNYGGRVIVGKGTQFAEYKERLKNADEVFTLEVEKFAVAAVEKIKTYREFRDTEYCKQQLLIKKYKAPQECRFWELYELALLCFYMGEYDEGQEYFDSFMKTAKNSIYRKNKYIDWIDEFYNYCLSTIIPQLNSSEKAQKMVFEMINRRRAFFNGKSSYKKMRKDIIF